MTAPDLITALEAMGCRLAVTWDRRPTITRPTSDDAGAFADLMPVLALHREAVVAELMARSRAPCPLCERVLDAEDREMVKTSYALCDRGGAAKAGSDTDGNVKPAELRCPFKS